MSNIIQKILVTAIIVKENKILMQKRIDESPMFNNLWTTPSGIVEINEHPIDALKREMQEELGVQIEIINMIPHVDSFPNHKNKWHMIYLAFNCNIISGIPQNLDSEEISEIKWMDFDEIDKTNTVRGTLTPIENFK